ncbi:MAG: hypothetical protein H7835_20180 [Magnetococcus sp. XQGC-1]
MNKIKESLIKKVFSDVDHLKITRLDYKIDVFFSKKTNLLKIDEMFKIHKNTTTEKYVQS